MKNIPYPHTPAPWHVETRASDILRDGKPVPYYAVAHTSAQRDCFVALDVAPVEIFFSMTGATSPNLEGKANVALISAAPDMLAALSALMEYCPRFFAAAPSDSKRNAALALASAAIAKATS